MLRDISLHILDLVQNSVKACASKILITVKASSADDELTVTICDNGKGMSKEFLSQVEDPFTTSRVTRKVGMGIPFFKLACELTGGHINIESELGKGTTTKGTLIISSIDRLPLGDLGDTAKSLIMCSPDMHFVFTLENGNDSFILDTDSVHEELGEVAINDYDVLNWISEYLNDGVLNIFGGVLNEITS